MNENIYKIFPRVTDYLGAWAITEPAFNMLKKICFASDGTEKISAHISAAMTTPTRTINTQPDRINNVGIVSISGVLMKHQTSLTDGTSTVEARAQIKVLASDPDIDEIVLVIDSPGGTVSGTADLANEISRAAEKKKVTAYIEDTCCSAAYWLASQAAEIYSNKTATIGSIGTFLVVEDSSKKNENDGIETLVFSTGKYKGAGIPGSEITDEQKTEFQRVVDELNTHFISAVSTGRGISIDRLQKDIATGQVWLPSDAVSLGLIDGIKSFEDVLNEAKNKTKAEVKMMTKEETKSEGKIVEPVAATITELKKVCPKADSDFILSMAERGLTQIQAVSEYADYLAAKMEEKEKALEEKEKQLEEAKQKKPGLTPVSDIPVEGEDFQNADNPEEAFYALVEKYESRGMTKAKAIGKIIETHPEIHQAFIDYHSESHGWKHK